jgi:DNA-binding transcriptional LysR family regulator
MIKTQHLRFLVSVVDYGSATKAAERLHISQPSISAGLKALEDELGGALFDRSGPANRPLTLTPKGQGFYRRAIEILGICESAHAEFSGNPVQEKKLVLGVADTISKDLIVDAIRSFESNETGIKLNLWEGSVSRLESWFSHKRVDVILSNVGSLMPNEKLLWREPLVAVVAPDHPYISTANVISIRDLTEYPFIHRSNCELDPLGRARLKAEGVKLDARARIESESLAFELIRRSKKFTLAPESLVPSDLVSIKVSGLEVERSIGLRWQEGTSLQMIAALSAAIEQKISKHEAIVNDEL